MRAGRATPAERGTIDGAPESTLRGTTTRAGDGVTAGSPLLDERVVAVQPSLVRAFGMNCAVVLQQVHWHIRAGDTRHHDGHEWVRMPYAMIEDETGLTEKMIRTAVGKLEDPDGVAVLVSCQPESWDRTKWYRIDHDNVGLRPVRPSAREGGSNRPQGRVTTARRGASPLSDDEDPSRSTRQAQDRIRDEQMAHLAEIDAEQPDPDRLARIREIREARRGGPSVVDVVKPVGETLVGNRTEGA